MKAMIVALGPRGLIGKCDERCWNSCVRQCHCICGGVMHGKGEENFMSSLPGEEDGLAKLLDLPRRFHSLDLRIIWYCEQLSFHDLMGK